MRTQASPDRQFDIPSEQALDQNPNSLTPNEPVESAIADTNEQAPVAEETKPLSPQFAALAKQRRALQQERANFDREKAEHAAQTTQNVGVDLARLKEDPLGVLQEAGVTYDQLTEAILNGQSHPATAQIKALEAKISALESGIDTKLTERDSQAEQQVVAEMKREAASLVSTDDQYRYTRAMGKSDEASRLVHENWKKTGEVWDVSYALELIEAECKKDYDRLTQALTPAQEAQLEQRQIQPQPQGMRTLTNRDTARPLMSRRDRMMAAFEGRLKK